MVYRGTRFETQSVMEQLNQKGVSAMYANTEATEADGVGSRSDYRTSYTPGQYAQNNNLIAVATKGSGIEPDIHVVAATKRNREVLASLGFEKGDSHYVPYSIGQVPRNAQDKNSLQQINLELKVEQRTAQKKPATQLTPSF